jgi:NAD(P)-dependent dehydrogenase (short-subunit alcohol dehydrogenase family)
MIGMHCIATLLLSMRLLLPQLQATAGSGSSSVVWTSSFLAEDRSPPNKVDFDSLASGTKDRIRDYAMSKAGNCILSRDWARRYGGDGIVSDVQNPGNLKAG